MKSVNVQGGFLFCARVEFSKIGKRDVTFIREMRVAKISKYKTSEFLLNVLEIHFHFGNAKTSLSGTKQLVQLNFTFWNMSKNEIA